MTPEEPTNLRERLGAGPARGLGCAAQVAREALENAHALRALVAAVDDERPAVMARAANALKRVQGADRGALDAFAGELIRKALVCEVLEARWNLVIVIGGLRLQGRERALAVGLLFEALASSSALTRVFAMQALMNLSEGDPALRSRVRRVVSRALDDSAASVRARANRLWAGADGEPRD